jgi:UDP-GlcNAc:undecaprenyl-phosphate GlcNAc-1-phosphate transferase
MGVLAILLTDSARGPFSPALALFLLGLPFLDTLGVSAQRLAEGRSPFVGDRTHIHHKLLAVGFSHFEAVTVIYAIQAGMVGSAYLLRWQHDSLILTLYLIMAGIVLTLFVAARHRLIPKLVPRSGRMWSDQWVSNILSRPWLRDLPIRFLAVVVPFFLIATVFLPAYVPDDVGYISIALFGIILLGISLLPQFAPYFVRGGLYLGTTFLLYVSDTSWMREVPPVLMSYHILFGAIAVMVLLSMRFDSQSRFQTTPLDYLMVCLAIVVPLLPEVRTDISAFGLFAGKLIVLFFSFELLLLAFADGVKQLGLVSLWILFGLGIRIWLLGGGG